MRTCAYAHGFPPIYFFFIYILFSGGRCLLFCRFFAVRRLFAGCFGAVCVVCYSVFFLGFCVLFFDSGFVWWFVWWFRFVLRGFLMLVKIRGCQRESAQNEGVSGVMSGVFACSGLVQHIFLVCVLFQMYLEQGKHPTSAKKALLLNRITMCFQSSKPMRKNRR